MPEPTNRIRLGDGHVDVESDRWAARFEACTSDDEFMKCGWSYLLASLASGWPVSDERREERRREVARALIEAAQRP